VEASPRIQGKEIDYSTWWGMIWTVYGREDISGSHLISVGQKAHNRHSVAVEWMMTVNKLISWLQHDSCT
jgi:hypothetical protein